MGACPCLTTPHYPKLPLFSNVHLEYGLRTLTIFAGRPAGTPMNSRFLGLQGGWWRTGSMGRSAGPGMGRGVVFIMFDAGLTCLNTF